MHNSDYRNRLEQAIAKYQFQHTKLEVYFHNKYCQSKFEPRKIKTIKDLVDALEKRAKTEKELRGLFCAIISLLEPPSCFKTHCKNYGGVFNWCNCAIGKIPGRCKENLQYLKTKKEKAKNDN